MSTFRIDSAAPRAGESSRPGRAASAEEMLNRALPHSLEAERAVLGSLLLLPEVCDEVALLVTAEDFYDDAHARVFRHMMSLHEGGRQIDPMLLVQRLKDAGDFESIGGAAGIAELADSVAVAAHAEHYAEIVHEKASLRALIHASADILREAYEPANNTRSLLDLAEQRVFAIRDSEGKNPVRPLRDVLKDSLTRLDARMHPDHASGGIETGFTDYDELTGGLHDSELVILAARPSMGKTALAMNMVEHVAIDQQKPSLFVSLEMSAIELVDRLLCSRGQVNSKRLRTGQISVEESRKLVAVAAEISGSPLYIDDAPSRTMTEIAANARRLKKRHGLSLVAIDYLQLIEPDNAKDPRQEQVSKIARRLKGLARELKVPVLCLAQLNRQVEAARDNKPQLSHLRESGAIEQDADVVMFVHRDEYYQSNEEDRDRVRGEADLLIRKQRNGPVGDIKLTWLHDFTRFANAAPRPYDEFSG